VVGEGGAPAAGGEGLLGDGVAEEHQPRPHLLSRTSTTDRPLELAGYLGDEITATSRATHFCPVLVRVVQEPESFFIIIDMTSHQLEVADLHYFFFFDRNADLHFYSGETPHIGPCNNLSRYSDFRCFFRQVRHRIGGLA
jgi:hypothetical protein